VKRRNVAPQIGNPRTPNIDRQVVVQEFLDLQNDDVQF
jgi:hypothetical protein